jgi:hypothetical protein
MARETGRNGGDSFNFDRRGFLGSTGWLRWERWLGAPCRYPVTAPEFRAHTHRRVQLPRLP